MPVVASVLLGRVRTCLRTLIGWSALRQASEDTWRRYAPVQERLRLSMRWAPGHRLGRLSQNIARAGLSRPVRYLEIGTFEGGSLALIDMLLDGETQATVVDPFQTYAELPDRDWNTVRKTFEANVAAIGASGRVRILEGQSINRLPELIGAGEQFDLIYVDGSHHMLDVMTDAVLVWKLLAPGGLVIFDDYWFRLRSGREWFRPKPAIDGFVAMMGRELEVVDVAGQFFVRKRRSSRQSGVAKSPDLR